MNTTHYVLLAAHYSLLTTHYLLLTTHYSLLTTHYTLLTTRYSLLATHIVSLPAFRWRTNLPPTTHHQVAAALRSWKSSAVAAERMQMPFEAALVAHLIDSHTRLENLTQQTRNAPSQPAASHFTAAQIEKPVVSRPANSVRLHQDSDPRPQRSKCI